MTREIPLSRGRVALVDDDLYAELSRYCWSIDGSGYPQRNHKTEKGWRPIRMHRHILNLEAGEQADHINLNKLDNRLANLRRCTARENVLNRATGRNNSTGYKGVYFNKARGIYQVYITVNYKHMFVGTFGLELDAARAYNEAALKHYGEFARLNDIP